jgi:hypothetical protein
MTSNVQRILIAFKKRSKSSSRSYFGDTGFFVAVQEACVNWLIKIDNAGEFFKMNVSWQDAQVCAQSS